MGDFKKLTDLAKKDLDKSEEGDDFSWIDDYLEENGHSEPEPKTGGYGSTRSMFDEGYNPGDRGTHDRYNRGERKTVTHGTYGGYGGSYSTGKTWWEKERDRKKPTYYAGGSGSLFGNSNWASGTSDIKKTRELLDAKSFVSNLVTIHDPLTTRRVTTQIEDGITRGIGNIFDRDSTNVVLIPEISTNFSMAFNKRLDVLSGQALMTATIRQSDIKKKIKKENESKIKDYAKKQANSDVILKTVKAIASMLSEKYVEDDVIEKSPGYQNYVTSFRDYYYGQRFENGIDQHNIFSPIDLLYVKLRDPEKADALIERAKRKVGDEKHATLLKVNEAVTNIISHMKLGTEHIFANSIALLMTLLSSCVKDIEDIAGAEALLSDEAASDSAMGEIGATQNILEIMNARSNTRTENETLSALAQLEEHDYSSYKMKDPSVTGISYHKEFEMNFYTMKGTPEGYAQISKGMSAYVSPLKRMMKFRDFVKKTTLTSQKRGKLDKTKLAVANSTDRIYKKTFVDKSQDVSICLLIDESGSMGGPGIRAARALACLFSEAFMDSKTVDLQVFGHTAQEGRDGGDVTIRKYPTKQSISDMASRNQNIDGAAIYGTAKEFLKNAKGEQKIMIVLSDGNPYASGYSGSSAVRHTKECVDAVEKLGIIPMQVAIASHVNSDKMFKRWFKFTDMDKFIPEMGKMIKILLKG